MFIVSVTAKPDLIINSKIGKVLMDLKIFLIIKLMLAYVNVNVNVNVNVPDNCLTSYTNSPVCRLIYLYPRVR